MKYLTTFWLLCLLTVPAHADMQAVGYELGPQRFRPGDLIELLEVTATSTKFEVGETVTVKGRYTLASHPVANVSLFVTQTEGDGKSQPGALQRMKVEAGTGEFELTIQIQHAGYLHVTFYPVGGGRGFGGVYFGKRKDMAKIKDWTLDWYLKL